jgi:hypothetical protein
MRRNIARPGLLIAACALTLALPVTLTWGEVTKTGEPAPRPSPERISPVPTPDVELRAQCWQHGVKIIDQADLEGLSLNAATRERSVTFKRRAEQQPTVFIMPFADGLCLVQPAR